MGLRTAVIILAMVSGHLNLIVNVVSNGSPDWMSYSINSTNRTQVSTTTITVGIWSECKDGVCQSMTPDERPAWLTASQVMYTIGVGGAAIALGLVYLFVCSDRFRGKSVGLNAIVTFVVGVSCACLMATVILYGVESHAYTTARITQAVLGWTYVLALVGAFISLITVIFHCKIAYDLLESRPYMEI